MGLFDGMLKEDESLFINEFALDFDYLPNIIKFREDFNKIDYEYHGNIKLVPKFISLGTLFEEKIKF